MYNSLRALADDKVGRRLGILGHRVAVHVEVGAGRAERIARVAVRLDLGGVGVEQGQAGATFTPGEDLIGFVKG